MLETGKCCGGEHWLPATPVSLPSPLLTGPAPLSHPHSPPPQTLLSHLPSPLPPLASLYAKSHLRGPSCHATMVALSPWGGMEQRHPMCNSQAHLDTAVT